MSGSGWYRFVVGMCVLGPICACAEETSDDTVEAAFAELKGSDSGSSGSGSSGSSKTEGDIFDKSGSVRKEVVSASVPQPSSSDIVDKAAAIRLGKALFWDMQTGTDGQVACASCHYHAGADDRRQNTLNPGGDGIFASGGVTGAGQLYSGVSITNDDRLGSQGIARATFVSIGTDATSAVDTCTVLDSPTYGAQRQVTGRNTPSAIGAVFFRDNFWDGRANHAYNGLDPFGSTGNAGGVLINQQNSSLASQSSGPPGNDVEMACLGRPLNGTNSLGAKLLARTPLQFQKVDPTDSVLGSLSNAPGNGLKCGTAACTYGQLINAAFGVNLGAQAQAQFSRFWGQAVQAYEATLVADQTPFDRYLAGQSAALTTQQQRGLDSFQGKGNCTKCHAGNELSDATVSFAAKNGLINEDGGDVGFHNVGVRPTADDLGRAGAGPRGVSFSVSGSRFDRGAFKTPALRNVKLTAPYFHNGGKATLADVVDFYSRGGDFANAELGKRIKKLAFSAAEQADLVEFLANGLTDCRVEKERAPFDHPSLAIPNGPSLPAVGSAGTGTCP